MKYIINGGISTTNIPSYTRDAILLAIQDNSLAGISLNLFLTKDGEIVAYQTATVDNGKENISDLTLHHLRRRNFGERVRNHPILTLKEALEVLSKTNKMLVLNLDGDACPVTLQEELLKITDSYPNMDIYIKADKKEIIDKFNTVCRKQRVGAVINRETHDLWEEDLDFFSVINPTTNCSYQKIKEKIDSHKRIMLEEVNTVEEYENIKKDVKDLCERVFVITDSTSALASIIIENYTQNRTL